MPLAGVDIDGLPQLVARLDHASDGITDLTGVNRDLAQLVANAADPAAPRRTGKLASSTVIDATKTGWALGNSRPYFLPVHWGTRYMRARPWLLDAATDTQDKQLGILADHVQQLLDNH